METALTIPRLADMRRQGLQHAEQSLLYAREGAEQFHRRLSCELAHGEEVLPDFDCFHPYTTLPYYPMLPYTATNTTVLLPDRPVAGWAVKHYGAEKVTTVHSQCIRKAICCRCHFIPCSTTPRLESRSKAVRACHLADQKLSETARMLAVTVSVPTMRVV